MTDEPGPRVVRWFDTLCDLLQQPLDVMPHATILSELDATFEHGACSWNWQDADGSFGESIEPADALDPVREMWERWRTGEWHDRHPLITWYTRTGDWRPLTNDRVPYSVVPRRLRRFLLEPLKAVGLEHQLSINYRGEGSMYRAFVIARGGRDFSDEDLIVSRHVQRALIVLDKQVQHLAKPEHNGALEAATQLGLTGRELAVIQLLAQGLSTRLIGRRLDCSTRTVEKHLEHAYRKLGVRDRLNAVRTATLCGLTAPTAVRLGRPIDVRTPSDPQIASA